MTGRNRPATVKLRRARENDAPQLLEWRNDADSVRFSASRRPVSEGEHREWLAHRLSRPKPHLWIAEADGCAVAQVRLDVVEGTGTVSIAVGREHRGRGFGAATLRAMIEAIAGADDVRRLRALTDPANTASLHLFEGVGFRRAEASPTGFLVLVRCLTDGGAPDITQ